MQASQEINMTTQCLILLKYVLYPHKTFLKLETVMEFLSQFYPYD